MRRALGLSIRGLGLGGVLGRGDEPEAVQRAFRQELQPVGSSAFVLLAFAHVAESVVVL